VNLTLANQKRNLSISRASLDVYVYYVQIINTLSKWIASSNARCYYWCSLARIQASGINGCRRQDSRAGLHSPDATGLSVHALPAIVDSSTAPVNSRSRPRAVPGTRCTRRSPIIAVPDGREGARPASRLRVVPRESVFLYLLYHPLSFPATRRRLRGSRGIPLPELRLNPAHLSLINRWRLIIPPSYASRPLRFSSLTQPVARSSRVLAVCLLAWALRTEEMNAGIIWLRRCRRSSAGLRSIYGYSRS